MCLLRLFFTCRFPWPNNLAQSIALRLQHLDQLPAAREQRVELLGLRIRQRAHGGTHALGEERQDVGVDAIGLGELPRGFREIADLPRIRDDHRQPGRRQGCDAEELVPTRHLEED